MNLIKDKQQIYHQGDTFGKGKGTFPQYFS